MGKKLCVCVCVCVRARARVEVTKSFQPMKPCSRGGVFLVRVFVDVGVAIPHRIHSQLGRQKISRADCARMIKVYFRKPVSLVHRREDTEKKMKAVNMKLWQAEHAAKEEVLDTGDDQDRFAGICTGLCCCCRLHELCTH